MKSLWRPRDARAAIARYAQEGVGEDLALRVYTTRLLGGVPELVLHGGGNTSVKSSLSDKAGALVDALCVKGSGWDMGTIEPPGLPAVRIDPLFRLRDLKHLSDEDMVAAQRANLIDSGSPNPSVETLLHAFLPHKFVDHTHANAVLSLTDQPDGEKLARDVYGDRVGYVPYIMPGFDLAKAAAAVYEGGPAVEGLVLLKHGIFSFGANAREAYERMIELVSMAEARLAQNRKQVFVQKRLPAKLAAVSDIVPIIRGAAAREGRRWIIVHRSSPEILNFAGGRQATRYARAGVVTPDHVIRVKPQPLILPAPRAGGLDAFAAAANAAMDDYRAAYQAYFERQNRRHKGLKRELDRTPRIALVPGLGLFAFGKSAKDASVAADIAEANIATITDAEAIGKFLPVGENDLFDIEYWSLEQAKLGKGAEPRLARQVVAVTGAAGAIGRATAAAFAAEGAELVLLDLDGDAAESAAADVGGLGLACDVTDAGAVAQAFDAICERRGGVDILVSNAGAAWQGRIGEVSDADLRASFELNFFAHQNVARSAVRIMQAQGTGGALLFNVTKQALNPGQNFGPYGLPKAATLHLMKQYAVDYGAEGIRSNAVNADRVRSGLLTDAMVTERAAARGVSETDYLGGNLLGQEVRAQDVGAAFVALALAERTTGNVFTVDGGNIAAAPR